MEGFGHSLYINWADMQVGNYSDFNSLDPSVCLYAPSPNIVCWIGREKRGRYYIVGKT